MVGSDVRGGVGPQLLPAILAPDDEGAGAEGHVGEENLHVRRLFGVNGRLGGFVVGRELQADAHELTVAVRVAFFWFDKPFESDVKGCECMRNAVQAEIVLTSSGEGGVSLVREEKNMHHFPREFNS